MFQIAGGTKSLLELLVTLPFFLFDFLMKKRWIFMIYEPRDTWARGKLLTLSQALTTNLENDGKDMTRDC